MRAAAVSRAGRYRGDDEHQSLILDLAVGLTAVAPAGLKVLAGVDVISGDRTLVEPDVAVTDPAHVSPRGVGEIPEFARAVLDRFEA